jgi:MurNAc alpha-1-phosphate uridylyltransferase
VESPGGLCAVVLAAGRGTRLQPLTEVRPKALCPVDNVPLIDLALASVRPFARDIAVNVHHLADQVRQHLAGTEVHVSDETDRLLGSAGALGHLHDWIAGRPVLVRNADSYLTEGLDSLVRGWDGRRPRVLGVRVSEGGDFGDVRYVGASLIPAADAARLPDAFAGLYDHVWHPADVRGELEVMIADGQFVDCGTPREYLRANLLASGGRSVVGEGAVVEGLVDDVVVWDGGWVGPHESLRNCIRVGRDLTIEAT